MGLDQRCYFLVGIGLLRSANVAEFMRTKVPGVHIPDHIVERLRKTPKKQRRQEGKRISVEIIQQIRELPGVAGIHVMAYRQEELVAEIIEEAGLLPRPMQSGWPEPPPEPRRHRRLRRQSWLENY